MRAVKVIFSRCALLAAAWLVAGATGCEAAQDSFADVAAPEKSETEQLSTDEVKKIIAQAASKASELGKSVTIAVVDHTGVVLGVLQMANAKTTTLRGGGREGLEGVSSVAGADLAKPAAISKAGTAAFFSTQGSAFTTRTAGFIIQEHFPPAVNPSPGGPLFGVQFSNLLCSDVNRGDDKHSAAMSNLPIGLSADPGGLPLYKHGVAVGGIGVEGDEEYTLDQRQSDTEPKPEERIALAGTLGYSAPAAIRGDRVLVGGIQLLFANGEPEAPQVNPPYDEVVKGGMVLVGPIAGGSSPFVERTLETTKGTVPQAFANGFKGGTEPADQAKLLAEDVTNIITSAARQAGQTRAAIRLPLGTPARVTIAVVDTMGVLLGIFRTLDAPIFGFDVSVQKARTAAFFSRRSAGSDLGMAGFGDYVMHANQDGLRLDGSVAFSTRAVGFLSQPIFPPGASGSLMPGPFSKPLGDWSIFNTGLQLDLYLRNSAMVGGNLLKARCTGTTPTLAGLPNGITIFPGGFPLYNQETGMLVGGIGVSGDGVEQDDLIAFVGSKGFEAPADKRSDNVVVRGVTLPYARFPRSPGL